MNEGPKSQEQQHCKTLQLAMDSSNPPITPTVFVPYNNEHITFVSSGNGTTSIEILQVLTSVSLTPFLASVLVPWIVPPSFTVEARNNIPFLSLIRAIVEYPVIVVAPVFFLTILSGGSGHDINLGSSWVTFTLIFMSCLCFGFLILNHAITQPTWLGFARHWNQLKNLPIKWDCLDFSLVKKPVGGKYPFVTSFRAIVTYITVICILAVDFQIFPRRFAKTKTYGCSLMDIGTSCFIFSNGIVAPESKNRVSDLKKSLKGCIPLVVLGLIRLITVKGTDYHEVVEEYGVHWNFFFTLAAVKILSSLIFSHFGSHYALRAALAVGIGHHVLLTCTGIEESYILNPKVPRHENFIAANREGICSSVGYLSIYLASVYVGKVIYYSPKPKAVDWLKYGARAFGQIAILWSICWALNSYPICRRSANLSYIVWAIATNYTLLFIQFALFFCQAFFQQVGLIHGPLICYELKLKKDREEAELLSKSKPTLASKSNIKKKINIQAEIKRQAKATAKLEQLEKELNTAVTRFEKNKKAGGEDVQRLRELIRKIEKEANVIQEKYGKPDDGGGSEGEKTSSGDDEELKEISKSLVVLPDLSTPPVTLEAICYNGLGVFLLGNLATGLVNYLVYTMYESDQSAFLYLWCYASVISCTSLALYWFNIQLKFW